MRYKNKLIILIGLCILGTTLISCGKEGGSSKVSSESTLSNDEIARLPEEQKDSELDKKIAAMREFRKKNQKSANGSMTEISEVDTDLPGQTKNRPEFDEEEIRKATETSAEYLSKKFNIDKNDFEKTKQINASACIDPRVNAIYDDDNKGVAEGYENENIYVEEYEDTDGNYKYLILVKSDATGEWKVIHDGDSYKK